MRARPMPCRAAKMRTTTGDPAEWQRKTVSTQQAPVSGRRDERGGRHRRGRGRDAVRDVVLAERAREGRRRAGRSRHLQDRAGPEDRRRMARQGRLAHQPHEADAGLAAEDRTASSPIPTPTCRSSRPTARTSIGRSRRRCWSRSASARISAARRRSARRSRRRTSVPTGSAASSVRATSRSSISPAACSRAFRRRRTS